MAGPNLPVNIDTTYPDSITDASQKIHQQHHDLIHQAVDDLFNPAHAVTVNVLDYGALGTWNGTTGADDTTAVLAAVTALQAAAVGGSIFFPPLPTGRAWRLTSPLPNVSGIRYYGLNREATRVQWTTGNMLAPSGALHGLVFEGLSLESSSGHLIDLGATGGLYFSKFHDCVFTITANGASIVKQSGSGNFLENSWFNCDMYRPAGSTVPAFDVVNTAGAANANVWKRVRASSANCTSTPFWRIEASVTGSYAYDNAFEDIVGEQNPGGLIHLYSVNGATFINVRDWDASTNYADHVIKIDKSATSTTQPTNIYAANVGRRGGTLGGGIFDFYMPTSGPTNVVLIHGGNSSTTPVVQVPYNQTVVIGALGSGYTSEQKFRAATAAVFDAFASAAALTVSPTYASGRGLDIREGVTGYTGSVLHARKFADTGDHMVMDGAGKMRWGPGDGTFDLTLERLSSGVLGINGAAVKAPQFDVFTSSGTWTKPTGATLVRIVMLGGGSGGGSGRRGAAGTVRCGGGGGGGGGYTLVQFDPADLTGTVSVAIGTGGAGGAAVTANDTDGNNGTAGGATTFGGYSIASVGSAASGGTASAGTGGSGGAGLSAGAAGGTASASGGAGTGGGTGSGGSGGGGSGGGITTGNTAGAGGNGSSSRVVGTATSTGGTVDSTTPISGTAPTAKGFPGPGAGGGAASITTAAQAGANATGYGGGGGGGGASLNGNNSGAGGNGASGYCLVISTF